MGAIRSNLRSRLPSSCRCVVAPVLERRHSFAPQSCDPWSFSPAPYSISCSISHSLHPSSQSQYLDSPFVISIVAKDRSPRCFNMHTNKGMRVALPTLTYLLSLFLDITLAQNFLPTTSSADFPGCGVGCNLLLQAQSFCVPPAVAVTSQFTYENCFCQSSFLQGLYSSPDAVCTAECTIESDRVLLQRWFTGFCSAVGQGVNPLASTGAATATATGSVTVVTVTSTSPPSGSTSTSTSSGSGSGSGSTNKPAAASQSW